MPINFEEIRKSGKAVPLSAKDAKELKSRVIAAHVSLADIAKDVKARIQKRADEIVREHAALEWALRDTPAKKKHEIIEHSSEAAKIKLAQFTKEVTSESKERRTKLMAEIEGSAKAARLAQSSLTNSKSLVLSYKAGSVLRGQLLTEFQALQKSNPAALRDIAMNCVVRFSAGDSTALEMAAALVIVNDSIENKNLRQFSSADLCKSLTQSMIDETKEQLATIFLSENAAKKLQYEFEHGGKEMPLAEQMQQAVKNKSYLADINDDGTVVIQHERLIDPAKPEPTPAAKLQASADAHIHTGLVKRGIIKEEESND